MKHLLVVITFIYLQGVSFSQVYYPVIEPDKYWDQSNWDGYAPCSFLPFRYEFTEEDSTINGFTYRFCKEYELIGEPGPGIMTCPPFVADTNSSRFAILREDTIARKVYIYDENSNQPDQLLYDFSINIGDTLKSDFAGQGVILILDSIEMVTLHNGQNRKKYIFNEGLDDICYIEGIGGGRGLFLPLYNSESLGTTLYCVKKNGEDLWGSVCNTVFVDITNNPEISVSVFPNPVKDKVNINLKNSLHFKSILFEIFDLKGTKLLAKGLGSPDNSVSLEDINPGVYIYYLRSETNSCHGKLVKL